MCLLKKKNEDRVLATQANLKALVHELINFLHEKAEKRNG